MYVGESCILSHAGGVIRAYDTSLKLNCYTIKTSEHQAGHLSFVESLSPSHKPHRSISLPLAMPVTLRAKLVRGQMMVIFLCTVSIDAKYWSS